MHINLLPEDVLGKILSLVPTKLAASTSVLSKKWRNVFALVDNLEFDDSVLLQPEEGKEDRALIFRTFVDRTLALQCDSPLKKFSLKYHIDEESEMAYVRPWICNAVERGVLELDVSVTPRYETFVPSDRCRFFANPEPVDVKSQMESFLPRELFTSTTLVKLTLGKRVTLAKLPPDVSLPALKFLLIDSIFFESEGDLCRLLLPNCPALEEFKIHHYFEGSSFFISSQTIKRLRVHYHIGPETDCIGNVSFDAPNLVSLEYSGDALPFYEKVNLESLVEATLDLHPAGGSLWKPDLTELVVGIRNVESLHLTPVSVDVIAGCVKDGLVLPKFNNLVILYFGSKNKRGWKLLSHLLKLSPKLETLVIQGVDRYTGDVIMPVKQVKVLRIHDYRGTAQELKKLKSFLGKIGCRELLQVEMEEGVVVDLRIRRELSMLLGVSVPWNCQIQVSCSI